MQHQNRRKADPEDSQAHVHRRKVDADAVLHLHARVDGHETAINQIIETQRSLVESMKTLAPNLGRIAEVMEAWNNAKAFWLTIKFVSAAVKVVVPICAFLVALWVLVKTGQWVESR